MTGISIPLVEYYFNNWRVNYTPLINQHILLELTPYPPDWKNHNHQCSYNWWQLWLLQPVYNKNYFIHHWRSLWYKKYIFFTHSNQELVAPTRLILSYRARVLCMLPREWFLTKLKLVFLEELQSNSDKALGSKGQIKHNSKNSQYHEETNVKSDARINLHGWPYIFMSLSNSFLKSRWRIYFIRKEHLWKIFTNETKPPFFT